MPHIDALRWQQFHSLTGKIFTLDSKYLSITWSNDNFLFTKKKAPEGA